MIDFSIPNNKNMANAYDNATDAQKLQMQMYYFNDAKERLKKIEEKSFFAELDSALPVVISSVATNKICDYAKLVMREYWLNELMERQKKIDELTAIKLNE